MSDLSGLPPRADDSKKVPRVAGVVALVVGLLMILFVACLAWLLWETTDISFSVR